MVARRAWLHRIIRDFTDPLLLAGTLAAVIRARWLFVRAVRAGLIAMPSDPIAEAEAAKRQAEDAIRRANLVQPPPADVPANEGVGGGAAPWPPASPPMEQPPGENRHVPHEEPILRNAIASLGENWAA